MASRRRAGLRHQRLGVPRVEPDPLPRKQLIVDRLPHQGVPKGVGGAVDDQHAGGDRLARRSVDGLGRLVAHGDEQLVLDPHAAGGDQPEHALRGLGELVVASEQDVAERVGEAVEAAHPAAADQFLHEEGHALGPQVHLRQLVFVGRPVEDRGRHLPHLPTVEAGEFEPRDAAIAVEFGQQCAQGAAAAELVASEGEHDQQPCVFDDPDQEAQQTQTLRIDPVQVFDHQHDGANRGDVLEHLGDSVVEPVGAAPHGRSAMDALPLSSGRSRASASPAGPDASNSASSPTSCASERSAERIGAYGGASRSKSTD